MRARYSTGVDAGARGPMLEARVATGSIQHPRGRVMGEAVRPLRYMGGYIHGNGA